MDEERRARAVERRRLMQIRLKRRSLSQTFYQAARPLCEAGVRFSKLMPVACQRALGPLASGPGQDECLDFSWMPNAKCGWWDTDAERDNLFREALAACTRPDTHVAVIWCPFSAGMKLRAHDLAAHAAIVLDQYPTVWVVAAEPGPWLIEVEWSGRVCHSPSVPIRTDSEHWYGPAPE